MVLGLCRLLLRDPVEAEDAAQQVFLSAHASVVRGSLPRDAPRWLAAIARNECRARIHARMRQPLALSELPSDLPDPLAAAIRSTDLDAIWAAISTLPRHQRRALVLRELGGLSYHELERALGVSHSAVESLLFRARQQVRKLVAAATPLAFRDELARAIPGLDPGTAGVVARVAAAPMALKLATAAVSVGVLTTGAGHSSEHRHVHRALTPPPVSLVQPGHAARTPQLEAHSGSVVVRARRHEDGHEGRHREHTEARGPQEEGHDDLSGEATTTGIDSSGPGPGGGESGSDDHSGLYGSDSHSGSDD
jgi:RNA polymerase sigma factor (sigma-70 family)